MRLYGEILDQPKLKFDYSSNSATDTFAKRGLYKHGPYDSSLFDKDKIKCVVLYKDGLDKEKQILKEGLLNGEDSFRGFKSLFRRPLDFIEEMPFLVDEKIDILIENLCSKKQDVDMFYILLDEKSINLYSKIKSQFLTNGFPSQVIRAERLIKSEGRQYTFENISLATYAKVGGTPWTVSTSTSENRLVLGVNRAQDFLKKYFVGFVVLFTNEGDFLFVNSKAPVIEWDQYVKGLGELVESSIEEYEKVVGKPESIIIHFHKRPGKKEFSAVESALKNIAKDIPYALVHINEYSNFRVFDSSDLSYVPPKGLKVDLSLHECIILLDGRIREKRSKMGVPRVLDVNIDKRSTISKENFPGIFKQVYDFSYINWRGFNAAAIPVTLNYSKLIARMIVELSAQNWNQIIASGRLRDKAWFL